MIRAIQVPFQDEVNPEVSMLDVCEPFCRIGSMLHVWFKVIQVVCINRFWFSRSARVKLDLSWIPSIDAIVVGCVLRQVD